MPEPTISSETQEKPKYDWVPHSKQASFLTCPADEVLYGGQAGGGKSDALLIGALGLYDKSGGFFKNSKWRALILRRTFPDLERTQILRSRELLHGKAHYDAVKHRWRSGMNGLLDFGHIKNDKDIYNYKSAAYNYIGFDELTEFQYNMYSYLFSRLRTTDPTIKSVMRAASNPGGVGHGWVKERFIKNKTPNKIYKEVMTLPNGKAFELSRAFIPATVYDNPSLADNDPKYMRRLMELPELERKALLEGCWDVESGQFFPEFNMETICEPFTVPYTWPVWMSMDWGWATRTAVLFFTEDPETGTVYLFDEIYETKKHPDEISKIIKDKLGNRIMNLCGQYCDRRLLVKDDESGISTQEKFSLNGLFFRRAVDDRVQGWHRTRELLMKDQKGFRKFRCFSNCENFMRLIPEMIHDINEPEDLNKKQETHMADALRYFAVSRKSSEQVGREAIQPIHLNPVTGYICADNNGDESPLRNRIPRFFNLRRGINYFFDRPLTKSTNLEYNE